MKRATEYNSLLVDRGNISIHALVKRATHLGTDDIIGPGYFNPRPREEGDLLLIICFCILLYFNPRPREEGDSRPTTKQLQLLNFNPRPREEGDLIL